MCLYQIFPVEMKAVSFPELGPIQTFLQEPSSSSSTCLHPPHRCPQSINQGGRAGPTLAWPGWKQPDIPVEVDTDRLETSRSEAGVLKKWSLAGLAYLCRLKYR